MCTVGLFFVTKGEYIQKMMLKEKDRTWLYLAGSVDAPCSMNMYLLFPLSHFKFISQYGSLQGCQAEREMHMFMVFLGEDHAFQGATLKIIFSSVFLVISRHACQSSGCDCTLLCRCYLQPEYKNKYGYPGPLPNHHSFSVLILKLLKPSAFLFSEFSFFFQKFSLVARSFCKF